MNFRRLLLVLFPSLLLAAFPTVPVRTWYEVSSSNLSAVYQSPSPPGVQARIMSAWNSAAYDLRGNRIIVTGGGHTDYAGNEVYAFDVEALTWALIKNGATIYDSVESLGYYNNGSGAPPDSQQPRPGHTYDALEYDSTTHNFYMFGSPFPFMAGNTQHRNIYQLNLTSLNWSRPSGFGSNIQAGGSIAARDPATGWIWFFGNGNGGWMGSLVPGTGVWTERGNFFPDGGQISCCRNGAVFPPVNRVIAIGNSSTTYYWPIVTSGNTVATSLSTANCGTVTAAEGPGFSYSPVDRKMVAWVSGTSVWTMDSTYTCAEVTPDGSNAVTPSAPAAAGTYNRFGYIPKYNAFYLVNTTVGNVYFYRLSAEPSAPATITDDPDNATVTAPATANFSVTATGTPTPTYQWQKDGVNIGGATSSSYTTPSTVAGDNGATYRCIATNATGTDTSASATLTVNTVPVVTVDPANRTVSVGQSAAFSVTATGQPAPTYQWQRGGTNIGGATSSGYTLPVAVLADNGAQFRVIVTNSVGADTSSAATLTVVLAAAGGPRRRAGIGPR